MTEPRATFTAMTESTAEDWQTVAAQMRPHLVGDTLGMDRDVRERHRGAPEFDLTAEFCADFDQCSFDPAYPTPPLEHFTPLVEHVLGGR